MKKNLQEMTPDEVCTYVRQTIRRKLGDEAENESRVYAGHGYFYVAVPGVRDGNCYAMRRAQLPKYLKEVK
jgi:hypothetical protein